MHSVVRVMTVALLPEIIVENRPLVGDGAVSGAAPARAAVLASTPGKLIRKIPAGESLFQQGEARTIYRIESGAVCHFTPTRTTEGSSERPEVLEHVFGGDLVGFGHLSTHISTARAMVETTVSVVSEAEFDREIEANSVLEMRMAAAAEREFEALRRRALGERSADADVRLAFYLLAIASINASEGREPEAVPDEITSGYVADLLDISLDTLSSALKSLASQGLVAAEGGVLQLRDLPGLERLASRRRATC